jgi:twitching motility protein PilJ
MATLNNNQITIPLFGTHAVERHQRVLSIILGVALLLFAIGAIFVLLQSDKVAGQIRATGQSLLHSQRLAKATTQALIGNPGAFVELAESSDVLLKNGKALTEGNSDLGVSSVSADLREEVDAFLPRIEKTEKNAQTILKQKDLLINFGNALKGINRRSADLLEVAESISALKLQKSAPASEVSAAGQLVMLTQRIGKSANEFVTADGISTEAVFLLGKDLATFNEIGTSLRDGGGELKLKANTDPAIQEKLDELMKLYETTKTEAGTVLGNMQGLSSAREAQNVVLAESESLRQQLESLQNKLASQSGVDPFWATVLILTALMGIAAAAGLAYLQIQDGRQRQHLAEQQALSAQSQETELKRVSAANQASILRLMNELQNVADGDLTQSATVTEDITGAIADSVNYTVEQLRVLVGRMQGTSEQLAKTTGQVAGSSSQLLDDTSKQLLEMRQTSQSVLQMAGRIQEASKLADQSSTVAKQFLTAANSGLTAVQGTIGGMNTIRNQIQETAKRMKRLGESSQEIGEITDLISDITEQTNVLALNAAIQAASAGEAGRGFTVVAEEVQRLAERSADATRQISNLVKAIQTDTQDVVAAMERSTQGVVAGAQLSENAGAALGDIDRISRQLTELIDKISATTSSEAREATTVASSIQHMFDSTERTAEGTKQNAKLVSELSMVAQELRESVSQFKLT